MSSLIRLGLPVLSIVFLAACTEAAPPKAPSGSEEPPTEDDGDTDEVNEDTAGTTSDSGTTEDTGGSDTGTEEPDADCYVYDALDSDCDMLSDHFEENELGTFSDNEDSDGDGLTDYEEVVLLRGHPMCEDTDGDTVLDHDEYLAGTDPWTVNPGLEDGAGAPSCVELEGEDGEEPEVVDLLKDTDGDGLALWEEAAHGISDDNEDSDGDTLRDDRELDEDDYNTDPAMADTDRDGMMDNLEVVIDCLDPRDDDSDNDDVLDGFEGVPYGAGGWKSDPCKSDEDADGLDDGEERTALTDPDDPDTDGDGLTDYDEVNGLTIAGCTPGTATSPILADTDSDGVRDKIEYLLGTCGDDSADVPVYFNPDTSDTGALGTEGYCSSWSSGRGTNFSSDYYGDGDYFGSVGGTECSCSFQFASEDKLNVTGVSIYTPVSVHQSSGSGATIQGWNTNKVPAGLLATTGWKSATQSDGFSGENGLSSDSLNWEAFSGASGDDFGTSTATDISGTVSLVVASGNLASTSETILSCSELDSSSGTRFRIDTTAYPPPPSHAVPPRDPHACAPGHEDTTQFRLLPQGDRPAWMLPFSGQGQFAGGQLTAIELLDWAGADRLALIHEDGDRIEHHRVPGQPALQLPPGWRVEAVRWHAWNTEGEAVGMPRVAVHTQCVAPDHSVGHPDAPHSYTLSFRTLDAATTLLLSSPLSTLLPDLDLLDHPVFRARIELPAELQHGPAQTRLRIDIAGLQKALRLRLQPAVDDALLAVTPPTKVTEWTFRWPSAFGTATGTVSTSSSALTVRILEFGSGPDLQALDAPVELVLPVEVW